MKLNDKPARTVMLLILFGVVLNAAVQNLNVVGRALDVLLGVISPLLLGLMLAFLLTIPVNLLEKRLIKPRGKRALKLQTRMQRPLSILVSVVLVLAVLVAVSGIIGPQLVEAIGLVLTQLPGWVEQVQAFVLDFVDTQPELVNWVNSLSIDWQGIQENVTAFLKQGLGVAMDSVVSMATSVFGQATSAALTFIIALSVVAQKEKLSVQASNLVRAFCPPAAARRIIQIARQTSRAFSAFITAQVLESCHSGRAGVFGYDRAALSPRAPHQRHGGGHRRHSHIRRFFLGHRGGAVHPGHPRPDPGLLVRDLLRGAAAVGRQPDLSPGDGQQRGIARPVGAGGHHRGRRRPGHRGHAAVRAHLRRGLQPTAGGHPG